MLSRSHTFREIAYLCIAISHALALATAASPHQLPSSRWSARSRSLTPRTVLWWSNHAVTALNAVQAEAAPPCSPRVRYTYNAMGVMQSEQADTNTAGNTGVADGTVDSNDPTFYYATDSGGQRTAVFRGSDAEPKETYINHVRGGRGPVVRDRDDALATDVAGWARDAAASVRYERYYFVNDRRGDVVALLSAVGTLVESYRYSATGMAFGQPLGDVNSDGCRPRHRACS